MAHVVGSRQQADPPSTPTADAQSSTRATATAETKRRPRGAEAIYVGYYVAQALVGIALWIAVASSSALHKWMQLVPERTAIADAFAVPDLAVIVVASLASAVALFRDRSWAVPAAAFTAGAVLYPTIYLIGYVAMSGGTGGTFAFTIMIPPSTISCWIAYHVWSVRR